MRLEEGSAKQDRHRSQINPLIRCISLYVSICAQCTQANVYLCVFVFDKESFYIYAFVQNHYKSWIVFIPSWGDP